MPQPSSAANAVFFVTVAVVWYLFATAARRVARDGRGSTVAVLIAVLLIYLFAPVQLARQGLISRYDPLPAPALLMIAAISICTVVLAFSRFGARVVQTVPIAWLVGFQAFRIPVEWTLHRLYQDGVVPIEMTYSGRNFDIVSGATALVLAVILASGRRSRTLVLGWNLMGLALLVNIVTVAVLATPVPFRVFTSGPPNLLPSTFPFVLLPTFLVQAALFGHILVFRALKSQTR